MPLLLDACQSAGQLPLDVEEHGCDIASATGRNFLRGPRGTGFLYVRRPLLDELEPPFLDLYAAEWQPDASYRVRTDAPRFENWGTYLAGKIGLGVAADYALAIGVEAIWERVQRLGALLRDRLTELPGVSVRDRGRVLGAIVTFTIEGRSAAEVQAALAHRRLNVSVTAASAARLDLDPCGIAELVRASVHYFNTEEEIDLLVETVGALG